MNTLLNKKKSVFSVKNVVTIVIFLVLIILPFVVTNSYTLHVFVLIFLYAAAAGSWNVIGGYAGQISLGHVAFFGIGAYTTMLLYLNFNVTPWIGLFIGGLLAAVVGGLVSYPCFKLRGPFFTLATLAFGEVLRLLSIWARDLTGGSVGLSVLYKPSFYNMIFPGKTAYYFIGLGLMALVLFICIYIQKSKFGYYLTALKEDHDAAEALGVNTARLKLYAMMISAFLTAVCGAFYGQVILYIEPHSVFVNTLSNQFAMIAVVGGAGTAWGPILGSVIITPLNEILRSSFGADLAGLNYVVFGVLLILVVTFMPNGLIGFGESVIKKLTGGKKQRG